VFALFSALIFSLINLFSNRLSRLTKKRKAVALSFFGGIAAAYVFLDLLPTLRQAGELLQDVTGGQQLVGFYEDAIFLIVFLGFLIFFVLEHVAVDSRRKKQKETKQWFEETSGSKNVFAIHLANFCFLNAVLSYYEPSGLRLMDRITKNTFSFKRKEIKDLIENPEDLAHVSDDLLYALDLARKAPSAANSQMWRFGFKNDYKTVTISMPVGYRHFKWEHPNVDIGICASHMWLALIERGFAPAVDVFEDKDRAVFNIKLT